MRKSIIDAIPDMKKNPAYAKHVCTVSPLKNVSSKPVCCFIQVHNPIADAINDAIKRTISILSRVFYLLIVSNSNPKDIIKTVSVYTVRIVFFLYHRDFHRNRLSFDICQFSQYQRKAQSASRMHINVILLTLFRHHLYELHNESHNHKQKES